MARDETNRVKRDVMKNIARLIPNSRIVGRKIIESQRNTVLVWASRDYKGESAVGNWY